MGEPAFAPGIARPEVAKAGGGDLATLVSGADKDETMRIMAAGPAGVVRRLFDDGRPGSLNWRLVWEAIAVMFSRMEVVEIIERI